MSDNYLVVFYKLGESLLESLTHRAKRKRSEVAGGDGWTLFKNEDGAIDLASIMVGIIVIGLIGGVIAATVFAVIPWSQDNAAKHQLESIHTAENAYFGLNSDPSRTLTAGQTRNTFTDSAGLDISDLLTAGDTYCVVPLNSGKDYRAYSQSASGTVFTATNNNKAAVPVTAPITDGCSVLSPDNLTPVGPVASPGYKILDSWSFDEVGTSSAVLRGWNGNGGYTGQGGSLTTGYSGKGVSINNRDGYEQAIMVNQRNVFKSGVGYKMTAWVKVSISGGGSTKLAVDNAYGVSGGGIPYTWTQNQWEKKTFTFTGKGHSLLWVNETSPSGVKVSVYMDDIVIEEKLP